MLIKEMTEGQSVQNIILYCTSKSTGVSVKGDNYISLTLQDSSGDIPCKIWDITNNIEEFEAKDFVCICGNVSSFKNSPQIIINKLVKVDRNTVNIEDFCPKTPKDIEDMYNELSSIMDSIKNDYLNKLLHAFFDNQKILDKFKNMSAAKSVHHSYVGGLLEHTLYVTKLCMTIAENYPKINRDLLLTSAILHDIGKIKELSLFPDNDYTDSGQLLGHIYLGAEMIDIQVRKIDNFPSVLANELKHCILAHHGQLEFGSPKTPMLLEALALSYADNTDAKLRRLSDLLDDNLEGWSDKSDFFLGNKYRKSTIF